jgi:internalin A
MLKTLRRLVILDLSGTKISGASLQHLVDLPRLERLDLSRTDVGDEAIDTLSRMKLLEGIELAGTKITQAGHQRLRAATPQKSRD